MNNQIKQAIETFKEKVFNDYEAFQYGMWKREIEQNPERKKGLHEIHEGPFILKDYSIISSDHLNRLNDLFSA